MVQNKEFKLVNEVVFDEIEEVIDTTASEEISNPEIEAADEKVIENLKELNFYNPKVKNLFLNTIIYDKI